MRPGKDPAKAVDKEFRRVGAVREVVRYGRAQAQGTHYRFPDDARRLVPSNISWATAHSMIREARERYGFPDRHPIGGERIPSTRAPKVDLARIAVTDHAVERRAQMREQDGLTTLEVATALTCPMHVLWMPKHGTYAWVGDRVAVVGHMRDGVLTIRTFLWTTNELWERNPRPEKELIAS